MQLAKQRLQQTYCIFCALVPQTNDPYLLAISRVITVNNHNHKSGSNYLYISYDVIGQHKMIVNSITCRKTECNTFILYSRVPAKA